jgi:hypothetical protein
VETNFVDQAVEGLSLRVGNPIELLGDVLVHVDCLPPARLGVQGHEIIRQLAT